MTEAREGREPPAAVEAAPPAPPGWVSTEGEVVENRALAGKRLHYAVIEVADLPSVPEAGQFFMVAPAGSPLSVLLRRPMSVARCWREGGATRLGFLYSVVGRGTRALAQARDRWTLFGPLGRGYPRPGGGPAILIAGGRGVAPLVLLAERLLDANGTVVLLNGARTAAELCSPAEMGAGGTTAACLQRESTEDGSRGTRGRVLDLLRDPAVAPLADDPRSVLYSCGPHGLLEAVGREARRRLRPAWVAVEAHMACGAGICRTCVIPRAEGSPVPPEASNRRYIVACVDGPVVEASTVDWESTP